MLLTEPARSKEGLPPQGFSAGSARMVTDRLNGGDLRLAERSKLASQFAIEDRRKRGEMTEQVRQIGCFDSSPRGG